jgi:hypothetical protein
MDDSIIRRIREYNKAAIDEAHEIHLDMMFGERDESQEEGDEKDSE